MTAERAWCRVIDELLVAAGVATGRLFSSEGLSFDGKYFAMLCRGELAVKLPAARVTGSAPRPHRAVRVAA